MQLDSRVETDRPLWFRGLRVDPMDSSLLQLSSRDYAEHVPNVIWLGDIPWEMRDGVLRPLCMPHIHLDVDRREVQAAVSHNHALLACWTSEWDRRDPSEWWWVICDQRDYSVDKVSSSRGRADIRKGLRESTIRRLEISEFSRLAYPIHRTALEGYGAAPPSPVQFTEHMRRLAKYAGTDFWAAFCGDVIAAYAIYQVIDGAVSMVIAKSNPDLHKHLPNAALYYSASKYYLHQGLRYVTGGARALVHPSAIQHFLEKLGWRKAFCRVNVELSPRAKAVDGLRIARWGSYLGLKRLLTPSWDQVEGFDKLMRIADTFTPHEG